MSNSNFFAAVILILLFIVLLIETAAAICHELKEDKSTINKILVATNCLIGTCLCINTTLNIEPNSIIDISDLHIGNIFAAMIALWFMGMIPAGALAVLSSNIAVIASKDKSRKANVHGFNGAMVSGFLSMFVAMSYGVVLYLLGFSGEYFPFTLLP